METADSVKYEMQYHAQPIDKHGTVSKKESRASWTSHLEALENLFIWT